MEFELAAAPAEPVEAAAPAEPVEEAAPAAEAPVSLTLTFTGPLMILLSSGAAFLHDAKDSANAKAIVIVNIFFMIGIILTSHARKWHICARFK